MKNYQDLLRDIRDTGVDKNDRTGVGTRSVFGRQLRFNLADGFPLLTTKKMHLKSVIYELLWFLRGETNIKYLQDNGVSIWDEWADEKGELGPVYGYQWRKWPNWIEIPGQPGTHYEREPARMENHSIDQITKAIDQIKKNPDSRRLMVTAWNPADVDKMALPPCHCLFQFYVARSASSGQAKLSCLLFQRSCDVFLGVPFNIASYALLTMMVAHVCDLGFGDFVHTYGDVHIYKNHMEQVELQLSREPRPLPTMTIVRKVDSIFDFRYDDFQLIGYDPHPSIRAPIAV